MLSRTSKTTREKSKGPRGSPCCSGVATGEHWGNNVPPKIVGVFIYYCTDVKKRPQRGCSIQLVATETADAIMAISVQGNYVIEITVKININE